MNVKENLPFQIVHYPQFYGTFIGFSEHELEEFYFCSCSMPAIEFFFNGNERVKSYFAFPIDIMEDGGFVYKERINYKDKLCHRCNLSTPSVKYCNEMSGSLFKQYHGWYLNQIFLKYGINRLMLSSDFANKKFCPPELLGPLDEFKIKLDSRKDLLLQDPHNFSLEVGLKKSDEFYSRLNSMDKEISKIKRRIINFIENVCRIEFGYKKIGEGWLAESQLFNICKRIFPKNKIERHLRPVWHNGLELDIFVSELNIGIEYQGQQHFHSIKAWGGEKSLRELKERDKLKKQLCLLYNVTLIEILFTESLTEEYVKEKIEKSLN